MSVPKRQEVETASFWRSGPRNWIDFFCQSIVRKAQNPHSRGGGGAPPSMGGLSKNLGGPCYKTTTLLYWTMSSFWTHEHGMCLLNKWIHFCTKLPTQPSQCQSVTCTKEVPDNSATSTGKRIKAQRQSDLMSYSILEMGGIYEIIVLKSFILQKTKQNP